MEKSSSGIKDQQQPDPGIRCNRCRVNVRPIHDRPMKDVLVVDDRLEVVSVFCYIYPHDMLSPGSTRLQAGCDYKLQVCVCVCVCARARASACVRACQVPSTSPSSNQPPSATVGLRTDVLNTLWSVMLYASETCTHQTRVIPCHNQLALQHQSEGQSWLRFLHLG